MLPVNGRPPYQLGHKGVVPEARTRTCDLLDVDQALWPLSYSGMALEDGFEPSTRTPSTCRSTSELLQQLDPTPGIEPGRGGSADRRLPTWPGRGCLAPGEGLEPPSRGSGPRALPVRPPWCVEVWRPRRGSNPPRTARQAVVPTRGLRGRDEGSVVVVRRGGFAPPQPLATGLRPAGLACARAGAFRHACLACHAYSVFNVRVPDSPGKKKGAWRRQAPCRLLL